MKNLTFLVLLLLLAFGTVFPQADEVAKWRLDHEAELRKDDGWLTVAGLFWLKEGANSIGAGSGFDVELTGSFKGEKFGVIDFSNGKAKLTVAPGVEAFAGGKRVTEIELLVNDKGKPTTVFVGSQSFFVIKREDRYGVRQREDRYGVRLRDTDNAARREFKGLKWYPYDAKYRVEAKLEKFESEKEILIPNVLGGNFKMKSPGVLTFRLGGRDYSLQPVMEDDKFFIIFRDPTSRRETYGAGRFLYAKPDENGRIFLDFNKSENPPCAFTPFATCPLPPPQNRLAVAIPAGEKRYH